MTIDCKQSNILYNQIFPTLLFIGTFLRTELPKGECVTNARTYNWLIIIIFIITKLSEIIAIMKNNFSL